MHITAGKHRKRRSETPDGKDIRPTSSMVREAIFNVLMHAEPADGDDALLQEQVVADICCGCGTLGLEALSRGAEHVVFVDKNRDGQKQEDEVPAAGAIIRLKGTRMSLRTDNAGYFTIQNIKTGLYEVQIDARSLPLGFDLSDDVSTKVTIADGQITDVPMPIVQRGQILGFTYVDENGDGQYNKGEERVEGTTLTLTSTDEGGEEARVYSTSFGQFAFGDLPAGKYEVATVDNPKAGVYAGEPMTVDLAEAENLMLRINLPVRRRNTPIRTAEVVIEDIETPSLQPGEIPPDKPHTMELAREGPAPP